MCVVLSQPVGGNSLWQPQETNTKWKLGVRETGQGHTTLLLFGFHPRAARAGPSPLTQPQRRDQLQGEGLCSLAGVHSTWGHRQPCGRLQLRQLLCLTEIAGKDLRRRAFIEKSSEGGAQRCRWWEGE